MKTDEMIIKSFVTKNGDATPDNYLVTRFDSVECLNTPFDYHFFIFHIYGLRFLSPCVHYPGLVFCGFWGIYMYYTIVQLDHNFVYPFIPQ